MADSHAEPVIEIGRRYDGLTLVQWAAYRSLGAF